jgi:diaminopimelate epimerase
VNPAAKRSLGFSKMHGIGNDFVVVDARQQPFDLDAAEIRRLGDRHFGVGFDQLLTIESATDASCAFRYGIYNTDGSTARQCGNGVRCVAAWLNREGVLAPGLTRLQSPSGPVEAELLSDGEVRVDMGAPRFAPADIPFVVDEEALSYRLDVAGRHIDFGAASMGNPHAVIVVDDVQQAHVTSLGAQLEMHAAFPDRCNVGFVQILSRTKLALRVWERGVGPTLACGTGACAAMVVLRRRGLVDDRVAVALPGGVLTIEWPDDGVVRMTGPTQFVFEGEWAR